MLISWKWHESRCGRQMCRFWMSQRSQRKSGNRWNKIFIFYFGRKRKKMASHSPLCGTICHILVRNGLISFFFFFFFFIKLFVLACAIEFVCFEWGAWAPCSCSCSTPCPPAPAPGVPHYFQSHYRPLLSFSLVWYSLRLELSKQNHSASRKKIKKLTSTLWKC